MRTSSLIGGDSKHRGARPDFVAGQEAVKDVERRVLDSLGGYGRRELLPSNDEVRFERISAGFAQH